VDATIQMAIENSRGCCEGVSPEDMDVCKRVLWKIVEPSFDHACMLREAE
jgi:hypothetical protein